MSSPIDISLSATDLSNHLACPHLTTLELAVKRGLLKKPNWHAPDLAVIQELGERHERKYIDHLKTKNLTICDLTAIKHKPTALEKTREALHQGVDVILQAALGNSLWYGRADVLRKIPRAEPNNLGNWSYEPYDCKLTRHTKGETILQLAVYSELLSEIQGHPPAIMYVVTPGRDFDDPEKYPYLEYSAYYEFVKSNLEKLANAPVSPIESPATANAAEPLTSDHFFNGTYPEPCAHCDICRWFRDCDARRRKDDHLSLVAGISRLQRDQLHDWSIDTMTKLSEMPIRPMQRKPDRGSRESYERVREQARLQVASLDRMWPEFDILELEPDAGFHSLPAPTAHDVFIDFEGDPFAHDGQGHQYLFGLLAPDETGQLVYSCSWAFDSVEEKRSFEWYVDQIMGHRAADPAMHVYHFHHYEPSQFKTLMGRYATRVNEVDTLLRDRHFVDLHSVFKQAIRAGVEKYTLKKIEACYSFVRSVDLDKSREAMRVIEHTLELGSRDEAIEALKEKYRDSMEGYNQDDCRSTAALRDWLEGQRAALEASTQQPIPRPAIGGYIPSEALRDRERRAAELATVLTAGISPNPKLQIADQPSLWLLAQLLDWHRREDKSKWWEFFRLAALSDDELLEDRAGLVGLSYLDRITLPRAKTPIDRYSYPDQEEEIRPDDELYCGEMKIGTVQAISSNIIQVKKTILATDEHPHAVFVGEKPYETKVHFEALIRIAEFVRGHGIDAQGAYRAARDLLLAKAPRLSSGSLEPLPLENTVDNACRAALALDHSVLAIQGPPGSGKTYTAARMIRRLVAQGKKVGVTALSHRVIRKVLEEIQDRQPEDPPGEPRLIQKGEEDEVLPEIDRAPKNAVALAALRTGAKDVAGGTSYLWACPEAFESVDYLFIDEAGQMALADVLSVAGCAKNLILIGDPQQLERPLTGAHPEGADRSALEHVLQGQKTMPKEEGLFLPQTRRLHPSICKFTSETFYENRLQPDQTARNRKLEGHPWLSGAGLWFVSVDHKDNRNDSPQEVESIAEIVQSLRRPEVQWFDRVGERSEPIDWDKILIIAPYNAQVFALRERLPGGSDSIGTVDKFQGQQAPVVIYSLTTSSPQDIPHGMEFLYSLNRFNVATSRAFTTVIVVGNPRLFEPECHTPSKMRLANAFCRFYKMSTHHSLS